MRKKINIKEAIQQSSKVKLVLLGEELIEKKVKLSGNSGRIYLPLEWVGKRIKIIRID